VDYLDYFRVSLTSVESVRAKQEPKGDCRLGDRRFKVARVLALALPSLPEARACCRLILVGVTRE
jgi:hypothetical protein